MIADILLSLLTVAALQAIGIDDDTDAVIERFVCSLPQPVVVRVGVGFYRVAMSFEAGPSCNAPGGAA